MVLGLPPSVKIYFATGLFDMRNGIDGLRAVVEQTLRKDPNEGHLFVFVGKSRDKVKILFWDKASIVDAGARTSLIFALAGFYEEVPNNTTLRTDASFVGGLVPQPAGASCAEQVLAHSGLDRPFTSAQFFVDVFGDMVTGLDLLDGSAGDLRAPLIWRSRLRMTNRTPSVIVDSATATDGCCVGQIFRAEAAGTRLIRSRITGGAELFATDITLVDSVMDGTFTLRPGAHVTLVRSSWSGGGNVFDCQGCAGAVVVHSRVRISSGSVFAGAGGAYVVANSIVSGGGTGAAIVGWTTPGTRVTRNNLFEVASTTLLETGVAANAAGLVSFDACTSPGCADSSGNLLGPALVGPDETLLDGSPALDAGRADILDLPGVPSTAAVDKDGQCRPLGDGTAGAPDIGPDER